MVRGRGTTGGRRLDAVTNQPSPFETVWPASMATMAVLAERYAGRS